MNAGASPVGRAFALRNCDAFFTSAPTDSPEALARHVPRRERSQSIWTGDRRLYGRRRSPAGDESRGGGLLSHCIFDNADWSAVDAILAKRKITAEAVGAEEFARVAPIRRTAW